MRSTIRGLQQLMQALPGADWSFHPVGIGKSLKEVLYLCLFTRRRLHLC